MSVSDPTWPKRLDGRPFKFGDLTPEQQAEVTRKTAAGLRAWFDRPEVAAALASAINGPEVVAAQAADLAAAERQAQADRLADAAPAMYRTLRHIADLLTSPHVTVTGQTGDLTAALREVVGVTLARAEGRADG